MAIRDVTIANAMGKTIARIEASRLQPLYQIGIVRVSSYIAVFQAPAGAIDPQIAVALTTPLKLSLWNTYPLFAFASKLIIKFIGLFIIFFCWHICHLSLGVSVYHSWTADYQPQGRYLFPVMAILMIGLSRLPIIFHRRFLPIFSTACFLMGV